MAKYYRQQGETKRRKLANKFRPMLLVLLIAGLSLIGWFIFDVFSQKKASDVPSEMTRATVSTLNSSSQIQSSPYFQFQATEKWRAVANESRDGHYVYREFKSQVVDQELVIDVNDSSLETLDNTLVTRVLPVSLSATGGLNVTNNDLQHCKTYIKTGSVREQQTVVFKDVSFPCNPDSTNYIVVVGLVAGSERMQLVRPNGQSTTYKIRYRNFSAQPRAGDLINIIRSFEIR